MTLIVNVANNWGIGKDGDQPFYIKKDLAFFKKTTLNKTILMGKNTLLALPGKKPLPKRDNIVLTSTKSISGVKTVDSFQNALDYLKKYSSDDVFIIGGASVYKQFLDYAKTALVTKILKDVDSDTFFPNLDENSNWGLVKRSSYMQEKDVFFSFCEYENFNIKY